MKTVLKPTVPDVLDEVQYHPVISLLLPFEPKMTLKTTLTEMLAASVSKIERALMDKYPGDVAWLMIDKLSTVIASLNYNTHKKSIAIYLSPVLEKVFYLDIALEEKIGIDAAFNIREVVHNKKQDQSCLIMLLTCKESRIYLAGPTGLIRIVTTTPRPGGEHGGTTAAMKDTEDHKKAALQSFFCRADATLEIILKAYPMPLFICGAEDLLSAFKNITRFDQAVIDYVDCHVADVTVQQVQKIMAPHLHDWAQVKQTFLMKKVQQAASRQWLAAGVKDVWREAIKHKGSLLLVEENFCFPLHQPTGDEIIFNAIESYHPFSYIKNTVDDIIEKVLENGGNVEFIDDGLLQQYQHIVLMNQP